jgi:Holliday junction resolvasome RuvABC endonuclease subunit
MLIAGIDPSLSNFGLAKGTLDLSGTPTLASIDALELVNSQADKTSAKSVRKNSDDLRRARALYDGFQEFIKDVELVFVEVPVGSQSARSMASYGVCIGLLASINKPLIQVTPSEVKLAAVGSKTASKAEMINWATNLYPDADWIRHKSKGEMVLSNKNEHIADAVGAIHAGILCDQFKQMTAFLRLPQYTMHVG